MRVPADSTQDMGPPEPAPGSPRQAHRPDARILVSGSTGFIGSHLSARLSLMGYDVRGMTRQKISNHDGITYVQADAFDLAGLTAAMRGIDVAYYLLHSMEGSKDRWQDFAERERLQAGNFLAAAEASGVGRIIYLGGLVSEGVELSPHMQSRQDVGRILASGDIPVTELRASLIIGAGGGSFAMLRYLVERLRVMVCPSWVRSRAQPIAVQDVVEYLTGCIKKPKTAGRIFEIGGPDIITYEQLMRVYSRHLGRRLFILQIPVLTTGLSSLWVDLITPVRASLARPLVDSLVHDTVVTDPAIRGMIPLKLKTVAESIDAAIRQEDSTMTGSEHEAPVGRVGFKLNQKMLMFSLLAMAICGTSYYWLDDRPDVYEPLWLLCSVVWYAAIMFAVIMVHNKTRLGYMVAGILSWVTLAFWLSDNAHLVFEESVLSVAPNTAMVVRNFAGVLAAALAVVSSHNLFHKLFGYRAMRATGRPPDKGE